MWNPFERRPEKPKEERVIDPKTGLVMGKEEYLEKRDAEDLNNPNP